jgi:iron complex outermembrane recepter protein
MRHFILATVATLSVTAPVIAQKSDATKHGDHDHTGEEIVVTGVLARNREDILSGTSVLTSNDLARELRPTIGETLSRQAGVSATSFGPNASRPVLRGFQGERVRVLADGIGSFDVSNTSVDHAVVINPLTADRVEVLRGPAALLYGSSAVGGIVNVIDSRIPRSVPIEAIHIDATGSFGSASNERSGGARIDVPIAEKFVVHFDGTYAKTDDQHIGGFILTSALRAVAIASGDPGIAELAASQGRLLNTAGRNWEVAGGAALITSNGNMGFSVSEYQNLYGVPVRYSIIPASFAEEVKLDVKQTRIDLRSEINSEYGFLEAIRIRGGFAAYKHDEIDDAGAIGTTFLNQGWEGRVELLQRAHGGWRGASGGQFFVRNLNIRGDEKFLPKSEAKQFGLFTLQSIDLGSVRTEAGGRVERASLSATADAVLGNADIIRNFTAFSGSAGGSIQIASGWRIGLNGSYITRAPAAEELFANGPHAGTQAFEIGDVDLRPEKSTGLEATLHGKGQDFSISASLYYSWFDGFIFDSPNGLTRNDLPVFEISQANAIHYGAEFDASLRLAQIDRYTINFDFLGDFTRATINRGGNIPRIPALRLLGGLEAKSDIAHGRVEVEWVDRQNHIAAFETPTNGYVMVNASLGLKPFGIANKSSITLSANNIFDVEARRHASFLKDYAPLAGRDIRVTLRVKL